MISRSEVQSLIDEYDLERVTVGVIGSHSALDVLDGAKDEGLRTIVVCQKGRETPYFKFKRLADEIIVLDKFADILREEVLKKLRRENVVFVPNRSFTTYVPIEKIEEEFYLPIYGNRRMLRIEERRFKENYYKLLEVGGIDYPRIYDTPKDIDKLVIVKLYEAKRGVERAFFTAASYEEYKSKSEKLLKLGVIKREDLENAVIEEYILGVDFYLNYFYSVVKGELEFHSVDRRFQTNLDGLLRLPARQQLEIDVTPRNIEVGHQPVTLRESLLEKVFRIGEKFVGASKKEFPPGIIGPFTLQATVTIDLDFYVFDVAPRIGGGTNIYMGLGSQYSKLYFGEPVSMGRRIAIEIKQAIEEGVLRELVT